MVVDPARSPGSRTDEPPQPNRPMLDSPFAAVRLLDRSYVVLGDNSLDGLAGSVKEWNDSCSHWRLLFLRMLLASGVLRDVDGRLMKLEKDFVLCSLFVLFRG